MPSPVLAAQASPPQVRPAADPLEELRRTMMIWAEPVIADRIRESYDDHKVGPVRGRSLALHHRRLWRALILATPESAQGIRRVLAHDLAHAGFSPGIVKAIDYEVIEELMDIVLKRFSASREAARGFGCVLLAAASRIGEADPAAV